MTSSPDTRSKFGRPSPGFMKVHSLDLKGSRIARALFRLRGLPEANLAIDGMLKWGFVLLVDDPEREIVLGLIGRFWCSLPPNPTCPGRGLCEI